MSVKRKIYIICPLRNIDEDTRDKIDLYVKYLEADKRNEEGGL
jgi:hypothetical protein